MWLVAVTSMAARSQDPDLGGLKRAVTPSWAVPDHCQPVNAASFTACPPSTVPLTIAWNHHPEPGEPDLPSHHTPAASVCYVRARIESEYRVV